MAPQNFGPSTASAYIVELEKEQYVYNVEKEITFSIKEERIICPLQFKISTKFE